MLTSEEETKLEQLRQEALSFYSFNMKHKRLNISPAFFKRYEEVINEKTKLERKKSKFFDECSHVDIEDFLRCEDSRLRHGN